MSIGSACDPVNAEDELSRVQRTYKKLVPLCNMKKLAKGTPQHAPQKKQMNILKYEMKETMLYLSITKQSRNILRNICAKRNICVSVLAYENLLEKLREEKAQQTEIDILNHLTEKSIIEVTKEIPSEHDEIAMFEKASNSLGRMETRLDLANKQLSSITTKNKILREEINRLLVERKMFNVQWRAALTRLVRGKGYLLDIYEVATTAFAERDECSRKLEVLKWKGLFQLNKDIADMQVYVGELNHLAKLEEFLRVKCSTRICEAEEIEQLEIEEELARCEKAITEYDSMLDEIFTFVGLEGANTVVNPFRANETKNRSIFVLMCEVMRETTYIRKELEVIRQRILDVHEHNEGRTDMQKRTLASLRRQLTEQKQRTQYHRELNSTAKLTSDKIVNGFSELIRISKCDVTPMLKLLGNKQISEWTVNRYIHILEVEIQSLIQVGYGVAKPPGTSKSLKGSSKHSKKLVADPHVEIIRPNPIEKLVPYLPCAYCVEDYIMNQIFITPAYPADEQYLQEMFHLNEPNTRFGIYTLTIPDRRHPQRNEDVNR